MKVKLPVCILINNLLMNLQDNNNLLAITEILVISSSYFNSGTCKNIPVSMDSEYVLCTMKVSI